MADPFHRAKLSEGASAWNAWRRLNPAIVPNLDGLDLSLTDRQFSPLHGEPIDLGEARLRGANLRHAALFGANLEGAILTETDLMNARLERANLARANLASAILDDADLDGATCEGAIVTGAFLQRARNLTQTQIDVCRGDAATTLPAHLRRPEHWLWEDEAASAADTSRVAGLAPVPRVLAETGDVNTAVDVSPRLPAAVIQIAAPIPAELVQSARNPAHIEVETTPSIAPVIIASRRSETRAIPVNGSVEAARQRVTSGGTARKLPRSARTLGYAVAGSLAAGMGFVALSSWDEFRSTSREGASSPRFEEAAILPTLEQGPTLARPGPGDFTGVDRSPLADQRADPSPEPPLTRLVDGPSRASRVLTANPPSIIARPAGLALPAQKLGGAEAPVPALLRDEPKEVIPATPKFVAETRPALAPGSTRGSSSEIVVSASGPEPLAELTELEVIPAPVLRQIDAFEGGLVPPSPPADVIATFSVEQEKPSPDRELKPATATTGTALPAASTRSGRSAPRPLRPAPPEPPPGENVFVNPASSLLEQANDQFGPSPAEFTEPSDVDAAPKKSKAKRSKASGLAKRQAKDEPSTPAQPQ